MLGIGCSEWLAQNRRKAEENMSGEAERYFRHPEKEPVALRHMVAEVKTASSSRKRSYGPAEFVRAGRKVAEGPATRREPGQAGPRSQHQGTECSRSAGASGTIFRHREASVTKSRQKVNSPFRFKTPSALLTAKSSTCFSVKKGNE